MPAGEPDFESLGFKVEMDLLHIHVRDFSDIQPEPLEEDLCVENESACAKLGTWITRPFQNQDAVCKMRKASLNVKSSGEPAGPSTNNKDVLFEHILVKLKRCCRPDHLRWIFMVLHDTCGLFKSTTLHHFSESQKRESFRVLFMTFVIY